MRKVEGLIWLLGVPAMLQVKPWDTRGAFHHLAFIGTYYKHVFTHINPADEFSFKETMTWGQFKISFGWLCVWCESKEKKKNEAGGGTGAKFQAPMVGSLSADFLRTMESY